MLNIKDTHSSVYINITPTTQKEQCKYLNVEIKIDQNNNQIYSKEFRSISGSRNNKKFYDEFNKLIKDLQHVLSPNQLVVNTDRDMLTHLESFAEDCMSIHKIKLNTSYCKFPTGVVLDNITIARRNKARDAAEVQTKVFIDIKPLNFDKNRNFESYDNLVVSWSIERGVQQISKRGPIEFSRYIKSKSSFDEYNIMVKKLISFTDDYNLEVIVDRNLLKRLELLAQKHLLYRKLSDEDFCRFPRHVVLDTITTDNENRMFSM